MEGGRWKEDTGEGGGGGRDGEGGERGKVVPLFQESSSLEFEIE